MGWIAGVLFPAGAREFSPLHTVQTSSGSHPVLNPMGTGGSFPEVKAAGGVKLTTHLHLVMRSRIVQLHLHSLICLHGVVLNNCAQGQLYLILVQSSSVQVSLSLKVRLHEHLFNGELISTSNYNCAL
jgi:hypothetical protein